MGLLFVTFTTSEGIADRGEVSYATWHKWISKDYVFGPYDAIVCVYNTIEGYRQRTGDRETIAFLVNDDTDPLDGYWRVVKREVHERFPTDDDKPHVRALAGQPRSYGTPPDELLPPFSDWSVDLGAEVTPRAIREVDVFKPRQRLSDAN